MTSVPELHPDSTRLVYRRSRLDRVGFAVAAVVVLLFGVLLFASGVGRWLVSITIGIGLALGIAAVVVNRLGVEVDDQRFVVRRALFSKSLAWTDIEAYYLPKSSTRVGLMVVTAAGGYPTFATGNVSGFSMTLEAADGTRVDVLANMHPVSPGSPPLVNLVRERVMGHLYANIRAAFDSGAATEFGPVSLSRRSGLVFKKKKVPLGELVDYSLVLRKGLLVLTRGKSLRVDPTVRWERIPNIETFLALFEELKEASTSTA